jgi:uncharacterized protein (TIGR01777 family)
MQVFMTGASGLIGKAVSERLRAEGHAVHPLVRGVIGGPNTWEPGGRLSFPILRGADAVIHLAGKNVATRWTKKAKEDLIDSRVWGTKTIGEAVAESFRHFGQPSVLISASAIGYYGSRGDEVLTEESAPGTGFLHDICVDWEAAAQKAKDAGVRVVHPRIGVVLSKEGGALAKMLPVFRAGLGGKLGNGRQWWSWITIDDLVSAIRFALQNAEVSGAVNFVGPNPVTNAEFTKVLGEVMHRPTIFPVPRFALHVAMGKEAAEETALASLRVLPKRLLEFGYQFAHADLRAALQNVLN